MLRIMVVDDEELAAIRLSRLVAECGEPSETVMFLDPLKAYEYAKTHRIDIAFLDISMPGMNGLQLSQLLTDIHQSIEIVFVTGTDAYAVRAFELNAIDYIMKPVTAKRLGATMKRIGTGSSPKRQEET